MFQDSTTHQLDEEIDHWFQVLPKLPEEKLFELKARFQECAGDTSGIPIRAKAKKLYEAVENRIKDIESKDEKDIESRKNEKLNRRLLFWTILAVIVGILAIVVSVWLDKN